MWRGRSTACRRVVGLGRAPAQAMPTPVLQKPAAAAAAVAAESDQCPHAQLRDLELWGDGRRETACRGRRGSCYSTCSSVADDAQQWVHRVTHPPHTVVHCNTIPERRLGKTSSNLHCAPKATHTTKPSIHTRWMLGAARVQPQASTMANQVHPSGRPSTAYKCKNDCDSCTLACAPCAWRCKVSACVVLAVTVQSVTQG